MALTSRQPTMSGADGVHSVVRTLIDLAAPGSQYTGLMSFGFGDFSADGRSWLKIHEHATLGVATVEDTASSGGVGSSPEPRIVAQPTDRPRSH